MNIIDMPKNLSQWKIFKAKYETEYMGFSEAGHQMAIHSLNELCRQAAPIGFKFIAKQLILGTLDNAVRDCLKIPEPIVSSRFILPIINQFKPRFEPKRDIVGG